MLHEVPELPDWAASLWLRQVHHGILVIRLSHFLPSSFIYQNSPPGGLGKGMLSIPNHTCEPLICWVRVLSQKWDMQFFICFLSWPFSTVYILSINHTQSLIVEGRELQPMIPVTENQTLYFSCRNLQTFHRSSVSIIISFYRGKFDPDVTFSKWLLEPEPNQIVTFGFPSAKSHFWLPCREMTPAIKALSCIFKAGMT